MQSGMDCAEKRRRLNAVCTSCRKFFLEQSLPGALSHLLAAPIGEGDDDQTWQNFRRHSATA